MLFCYLSNKDIIRLQCLQNRAARIILQVPRPHSSSPLLQSLHWLPVDSRIKFKIMLYIYKILNNMTPVYLSNCVKVYVPAREGLRSAMDATRLKTPLTHKTDHLVILALNSGTISLYQFAALLQSRLSSAHSKHTSSDSSLPTFFSHCIVVCSKS